MPLINLLVHNAHDKQKFPSNLKRITNLAKSCVPKNCTGTDPPPESLLKPLRSRMRDSFTTIAGHIA